MFIETTDQHGIRLRDTVAIMPSRVRATWMRRYPALLFALFTVSWVGAVGWLQHTDSDLYYRLLSLSPSAATTASTRLTGWPVTPEDYTGIDGSCSTDLAEDGWAHHLDDWLSSSHSIYHQNQSSTPASWPWTSQGRGGARDSTALLRVTSEVARRAFKDPSSSIFVTRRAMERLTEDRPFLCATSAPELGLLVNFLVLRVNQETVTLHPADNEDPEVSHSLTVSARSFHPARGYHDPASLLAATSHQGDAHSSLLFVFNVDVESLQCDRTQNQTTAEFTPICSDHFPVQASGKADSGAHPTLTDRSIDCRVRLQVYHRPTESLRTVTARLTQSAALCLQHYTSWFSGNLPCTMRT